VRSSLQNKPVTYLEDVIRDLTARWPDNAMLNIVCHGHSVPAGYFETPVIQTFDSYPHLLHQALKAIYRHAAVNVIVTAIGAEHSENGARRFEADVLSHRPRVVTIDYALNDRKIGLTRAEAAWRTMIENALRQQLKVILLTPTPALYSDYASPGSELDQHALQIQSLADEYSIGLADSRKSFLAFTECGAQLADLMATANHPNRAGHEIVAKCLLPWFTATPS
jgi:acyl-CoA thioesterase I